jgi:hypothetical protein
MKTNVTINGVTHEIDLTPEQVAKIESSSLVTTWEQAYERIKPVYFVSSIGIILSISEVDLRISDDVTNVPTEKHAKSVLALCQLFTIASCLNKTVERVKSAWIVIYDLHTKEFICDYYQSTVPNSLYLHSKELAQHLITHFEPLLKDFYMVD